MNDYLVPVFLILVGAAFAYRPMWFVAMSEIVTKNRMVHYGTIKENTKQEYAQFIRILRIIGLLMLLIGINWLVFAPLFIKQ